MRDELTICELDGTNELDGLIDELIGCELERIIDELGGTTELDSILDELICLELEAVFSLLTGHISGLGQAIPTGIITQ